MATRLSVPTTSEKITFVLNDFSGGIVNNVNDVKMNDNQSPDMLNMQFRVDGLIQKRPGTIFVSSSPVFGGAKYEVRDVIKYEYGAGNILLIYRNQYQLYYENHLGKQVVIWESPYASSGLAVHEHEPWEIRYVNFNGTLVFSDGIALYSFRFEGNDFKPVTCKYVLPPEGYTPKAKPAVTGETKRTLIKELKFFHYIYEEGHDYTDEEYPYQDDWGAYKIVTEGEWSWNEYKDVCEYWDENSLGAEYYECWYEPCEYELEDGYKGTPVMPPSIGCMEVHKNRIYISGSKVDPNMIWITDILNPAYFPASMVIQAPPNDDYITALHAYNDVLIVGRKHSIYALFGNTNRSDSSSAYNFVQLNSHTGMANHKSANKVFHMLFFVGSDGNLYKLLPASTVSDTMYTTQLNKYLDITLPPFNLSVINCEHAISCFDSKEGLWYVQIGDHTLVYNYSLMAWTRYNNINPVMFYNIDNDVYFLSIYGSVYKMPSKDANQDYLDDWYDGMQDKVIQIPINAYWTSRNMDMGQPARVKQFRDTYVTTECFEDHPTNVNLKYEVDYIDISSSTVIENEISKWDKAKFNVNKFISRNIDRSLPLMINRRGRTLKVYYGSAFNFVGSYWGIPEPIELKELDIFFNIEDDKFYQRVASKGDYNVSLEENYYNVIEKEELSQALLVHNITGLYQLKGYR